MGGQVLDRITRCYRIGDADGAYPIFDATGSGLFPGRWNTAGSPLIYTSEHYSTAMLEKLARGAGTLPPNQHYVEILLPPGLSYEVLDPASLPGWDQFPPTNVTQQFGETWFRENRSLLLFVPSIVARIETNILLNPMHPQFRRIDPPALHRPVWWDARLFAK